MAGMPSNSGRWTRGFSDPPRVLAVHHPRIVSGLPSHHPSRSNGPPTPRNELSWYRLCSFQQGLTRWIQVQQGGLVMYLGTSVVPLITGRPAFLLGMVGGGVSADAPPPWKSLGT